MGVPLTDLYQHQAWADAEQWRASMATDGAHADREWFERQHHIHLVQRAFLSIVRGEEVDVTEPGSFSPEGLREHARSYHGEVLGYLETVTSERLDEYLEDLPWFRDPPIRLRVREALTQAALHSQWHRGQNASRLRQLGGEPPTTDFIVWIWKERPAPAWPD